MINIRTEVHGLVQRIIVVSQLTVYLGDLYIIYSVIIQHFPGYLFTTQPVRKPHPGILGKLTLKPTGNH
ncbi:hypothetical protein D9M69_611490 [compost metagenome]